jgi:AhpD family alkylhydroperoxidase
MTADLIQSQREGIVTEKLSSAKRELVALGTALGSNCVPCIEYHIPEARKAGLSDRQINEAIRLGDKVRQVPARKVLAAALGVLPEAHVGTHAEQSGPDCGQPVPDGGTEQPSCGAYNNTLYCIPSLPLINPSAMPKLPTSTTIAEPFAGCRPILGRNLGQWGGEHSGEDSL